MASIYFNCSKNNFYLGKNNSTAVKIIDSELHGQLFLIEVKFF